jgi:predicted RNA-binding protein with PUA-like domain
MQYWLVKSDPETYSWNDFLKDKTTPWDGVRNYQARNNLKEMKKGDRVLFYHSIIGKAVFGIAKVTLEAFQDPTTDDERWVAVQLAPVKTLRKSITLEQIKDEKKLTEISLIKQSRLSVMPLTKEEYDTVLSL